MSPSDLLRELSVFAADRTDQRAGKALQAPTGLIVWLLPSALLDDDINQFDYSSWPRRASLCFGLSRSE